jgi:hypothetical protein
LKLSLYVVLYYPTAAECPRSSMATEDAGAIYPIQTCLLDVVALPSMTLYWYTGSVMGDNGCGRPRDDHWVSLGGCQALRAGGSAVSCERVKEIMLRFLEIARALRKLEEMIDALL